jgi:outer membrane protein, multidrug efflux system
MKRPGLAALVVMVLALPACSRKFEPPARPFTVEPPKTWSAAEVSADAMRQEDWWAVFGDGALDRAITEALTKNQDLRAVAVRIEAAQAEARIAGAALQPNVELSLNRGRQRQNFVGLPIPGREGSVLSTTYTTAGVGLNFGWEADLWGRVKSGHIAALAGVEAQQADLAGARLSLSGQTAKAWLAAIEAQRQVAVARDTLDSYQVSAERVRARFERGLRPSLDLRLALTEVSRAEALLEQRREQLSAAVRQLEILLGRYPSGEYALAEDLPLVPTGVPAGLPSELVHRRPDLAAAERRLLAADARIAEAKAELRPRFSLTSGTGTSSNQLRDLLSQDVFVWNLLGNLVQPLFNGGRLKAGVKLNEARAREAASLYEQALLEAYGEVETALAAEGRLAERERALEAATKQSLAARDLAEQRYQAGLADITTVLASQRSALESESQLLSVRRARLENRINLYLALGGGFRNTFTAKPPAAASDAAREPTT